MRRDWPASEPSPKKYPSPTMPMFPSLAVFLAATTPRRRSLPSVWSVRSIEIWRAILLLRGKPLGGRAGDIHYHLLPKQHFTAFLDIDNIQKPQPPCAGWLLITKSGIEGRLFRTEAKSPSAQSARTPSAPSIRSLLVVCLRPNGPIISAGYALRQITCLRDPSTSICR
jgi:hypothetical protein